MATQNNKPVLHRKEWQMMTPAPTATAAGAFVIADGDAGENYALYMLNATTHYMYHLDEDAWMQIPSGALAGTFGAGACGAFQRWSNTVTATGGSTTTMTTTAAINGFCIGSTMRVLTGANAGLDVLITGAIIVPGGTSTVQFAALGSAMANTDTVAFDTGTFFVMNAGTIAAGIFKSFDPLTGVWTSLGTTNLPATWGTDGRLLSTSSKSVFATGTAASGTTTTITVTGKTWTANQWTNYQVRVTAGTNKGLARTIASNTGNVLTTAAFPVACDATTVYEITGNDDYLYLLGNNAVTMYRYSKAGNTWTVMAPTTARAAAPVAGMSGVWVGKTGDANWANESAILDGRYIYSFRGGASTLDRFDIAGGTAGAGAWAAITYNNATETFATGSSYFVSGRYVYIRKDATHRYFKYSVRGNYLEPLSTNLYADSTAVLGMKTWVKEYDTAGNIKWLYSLRNTGTELFRLPLY